MEKPKPSSQFDKQFGLYVKKKRLELKLSQADLASRVGNNYQNVSRLERGEISPTLFWCFKLAEAFVRRAIKHLGANPSERTIKTAAKKAAEALPPFKMKVATAM